MLTMMSDPRAALSATTDGVLLRVRVSPRAKQDALSGLQGDALRVRLSAPPADGKANSALVSYLAAVLDVPARDITIVRGHTSRSKVLRISGLSADLASARLAERFPDT